MAQVNSNDTRHFVVEVDGPSGRAFAICQQIMLIDAEQPELGGRMLEGYVRGGALSAAPLAGANASQWLMSASTAQSAQDDDDDTGGE